MPTRVTWEATMDMAGWLRSLGLERYEAAFRENEIDEAVLNKLTEDHLRELGVPLGARLKLLDAIAALRAASNAAASPPAAPPPTLPSSGNEAYPRGRWRAPLSHGAVL